jgi:hypothetical protein
MKLKYYVLLFIAFFTTLCFFGCDLSTIGSTDYGTAQINGFVMDVSTQIGINDVTILTAQSQDSTYSNTGGYFFILDFVLSQDPQDVDIIAVKEGYQTAQLRVALKDGEIAQVTIPMTKK